MSLEPGYQLAHYEIVEPIGRGGMGEVYRAKDSKLGRDVAIKVLPDEFARDSERLRRFQREAKVLASLNHPNIAAIYGLEQSGGTHYLVLELVPGETLADRIARGPISVEEALAIASQIADALEEAHERGIVHRDLKPANVKLTEEGKVKVLDFGLAKALEDEAPEADSSMSPTRLRQGFGEASRLRQGFGEPSPAEEGTALGVILGTAAYMSPEQAKGKQVDKRADVWAFGVVVYEMLTGKRAFEGEDVSDTLAYVLTKEPDWSVLPADTPASLARVLRLCVIKDPKRRARDIGDVRLAMEGAFATEPSATVDRRPTRGLPTLAIMLAALVVIAGFVVWSALRDATPPRVTRTSIVLPQSHVRTETFRRELAVSPAGTHVVYVANDQLYVRALDETEAQPLRGTENSDARLPFFSPDGQWIGFYSVAERRLEKIALGGGAPVELCEIPPPYGTSWLSDDAIVFAQPSGGIFRVSATGGTPELLIPVETEGGERARAPHVLPDNRTVLFTVGRGNAWNEAQIVAHSLDTGTSRVLIERGTDARYLPTGHLVYALEGNLFAVAFDPGRLETLGGPVPVIENVSYETATGSVHYDISRDGLLVYLPRRDALRTLVWVDRQGREEPIAAEPHDYSRARISPDGTQAILVVDRDLWLWDFARETLTRVTFHPAQDGNPEWMPDGRHIVFASAREGPLNLYRKAVDGTGDAERLSESPSTQRTLSVTPDGNAVLVHHGDAFGVLTLDGDGAVVPVLQSDFYLENATLSPDGRWLAYESSESGQMEVYVRPFPDVDSGRWPISSGGGIHPLWGPRGDELFFRTRRGHLMRVAIETDPELRELRRGNPDTLLEPGPYIIQAYERPFDISPDGERFLMIKEGTASLPGQDPFAGLTQLIVVQHWLEELERLVPTR